MRSHLSWHNSGALGQSAAMLVGKELWMGSEAHLGSVEHDLTRLWAQCAQKDTEGQEQRWAEAARCSRARKCRGAQKWMQREGERRKKMKVTESDKPECESNETLPYIRCKGRCCL